VGVGGGVADGVGDSLGVDDAEGAWPQAESAINAITGNVRSGRSSKPYCNGRGRRALRSASSR
jgi:hypothetical protein